MALSKEDLQAIKGLFDDDFGAINQQFKSINERLTVIENDHSKKLNLVLESQIDMNRNLESMNHRLTAVEETLANAIVVKAVAPKE